MGGSPVFAPLFSYCPSSSQCHQAVRWCLCADTGRPSRGEPWQRRTTLGCHVPSPLPSSRMHHGPCGGCWSLPTATPCPFPAPRFLESLFLFGARSTTDRASLDRRQVGGRTPANPPASGTPGALRRGAPGGRGTGGGTCSPLLITRCISGRVTSSLTRASEARQASGFLVGVAKSAVLSCPPGGAARLRAGVDQSVVAFLQGVYGDSFPSPSPPFLGSSQRHSGALNK
jgi:hypothetical protein